MEQSNQSSPANALDTPPEEGAPSSPQPNTPDKDSTPAGGKPPKQPNAFKKFFKKVNLYLLIFVFVALISGAYTIVTYLNSKKETPVPSIANQPLSQDAVNELTKGDTKVGGSGQTLTVQGNAIFSGQVLTKGDLGVAGNIVANSVKASGEVSAPQMTASVKATINDAQINTLQVAANTTLQGTVTLQKDLNVGGTASFSGPVTAGTLTVTNLIMSGNASLRIPNHIAFPGASPGRTINSGVLGAGGSGTVNGSDTTGTINVNTGNGTTPGCFVTITFNQKFTSAPHVIVSPIGQGAGQTQYYVNRDASGFSVCTANAAPQGQVFGFDYFVTQ